MSTSTKKQLAQASAILRIEAVEKEIYKNLNSYDEACRDNLMIEAEVAYELARDRMKRVIKRYEVVIPNLTAKLK